MGLNKLAQEDPSFNYSRDEETGQTVIEGMGELHLEIIVDRLRREFKVCFIGTYIYICSAFYQGQSKNACCIEVNVHVSLNASLPHLSLNTNQLVLSLPSTFHLCACRDTINCFAVGVSLI